jgi:hypothetical protein
MVIYAKLIQLSKRAKERKQREVDSFKLRMSVYSVDQIMNADETAIDERTRTRASGWAPIGERARAEAFFKRGDRLTLMYALGVSGTVDRTLPG